MLSMLHGIFPLMQLPLDSMFYGNLNYPETLWLKEHYHTQMLFLYETVFPNNNS